MDIKDNIKVIPDDRRNHYTAGEFEFGELIRQAVFGVERFKTVHVKFYVKNHIFFSSKI